ncbi:hypothetical protein EDB89DRAFT_2248066 [Lactarius sanguifluus]|nr:hypothetical protein EDB89DRAFT_2248066 [Lactarius sanguifluus]
MSTREYAYSYSFEFIHVAIAVAIVVSIVVDCRRRGPSSSWAVVVVRLTCLAVAAGVITSLIAGVDPSGALAGADTSRSWFMVDARQRQRQCRLGRRDNDNGATPVDDDRVMPATARRLWPWQRLGRRDDDDDDRATPVNYGNGATSTDIDSDSKTTPPPPTTTMTTTTTGDRDDYLDGELLCSI